MNKRNLTPQEKHAIWLFTGWTHTEDNKGNCPASSWEWLMELLGFMRVNHDVAWSVGSKEVKLHDHLIFDYRSDVHNVDPLPEMFAAAMAYVNYNNKQNRPEELVYPA